MVIETEVKFKLKCNPVEVMEKVSSLKPILIEEYCETDTYYNHPCRDFRESDEALRLRMKMSNSGLEYFLTYKSARIPSEYVKKRVEYEVSISDYDTARSILKQLGFIETISFSKKRIVYRVNNSYLYIDELFGLGLFIEIEGFEKDIVELTNMIRDCVERIDKTYLEICLETSSCKTTYSCL